MSTSVFENLLYKYLTSKYLPFVIFIYALSVSAYIVIILNFYREIFNLDYDNDSTVDDNFMY